MSELRVELAGMPFEDWLRVCCEAGDHLRVICHGILAVQNMRSKVVYVFGAADEDRGAVSPSGRAEDS